MWLLIEKLSDFGVKQILYRVDIALFSIYTLSDLGDLSNLIGSLSRTI